MSASRSDSRKISMIFEAQESCYEIRPCQDCCFGHLLFEGSGLHSQRNGVELPIKISLRKMGLEFRYDSDGSGSAVVGSTSAFCFSPLTIVKSLSTARLALKFLWRSGVASCSEPEHIDLILETQREADVLARCVKAALEDLCRACMTHVLKQQITSDKVEAVTPLPPATGGVLVFGHMLYSSHTLDAGLDGSPILALAFAELCTPAVATSEHSSDTRGVRWHSLRIYSDRSRKDCLAAIAVCPGSEIDYIGGHCTFLVQERLSHIFVVRSSQEAMLWVDLLRYLCLLDPTDLQALHRAVPSLTAKASGLKAELKTDSSSSEILWAVSRSPFLPAKPRRSEPTLLTSRHTSTKSNPEEGFDVAAALLECGIARAKPSDTCVVAMTIDRQHRKDDPCDDGLDMAYDEEYKSDHTLFDASLAVLSSQPLGEWRLSGKQHTTHMVGDYELSL